MRVIYLIVFISLVFSFTGYSRPHRYIKSLSTIEFKEIIRSKSVKLVDVRTSKEFAKGHIPRAVNIDVKSADFVAHIKRVCKNKPLAFYCQTGGRSKLAANKLKRTKIKIYDLKNGFKEWQQAGFPVSKE